MGHILTVEKLGDLFNVNMLISHVVELNKLNLLRVFNF